MVPDLFVINICWPPDEEFIKTDNWIDKIKLYLLFLHTIDPLIGLLFDQRKSALLFNGAVINIAFHRYLLTILTGIHLISSISFAEADTSDLEIKRMVTSFNCMLTGALEAAKQ